MTLAGSLRRAATAGALLAAALLAGCEDDTGPVDSEIFSVRLTVDGRTTTIDRGGDVTGGPIQLTADSDADVSGEFLDADGAPVAAAGTVRLRIESADLSVIYIRSGNTTGTLRAEEGGPYTVEVQVEDAATDRLLFAEEVEVVVESPLD